MKKIKLLLLAAIAVSMLTACSAKNTHSNTAGTDTINVTPSATSKADSMMKDGEDAVGDAAKGVGDVAGDAVEGAGNVVKDAGDVVGEAAKDIGNTADDAVTAE